MPVTILDPKTALVVVDLQKGIVSLAGPAAAEVVQQARALAGAFRVNVAGGAPGRTEQSFHRGDLPADWADLVPELNQQPSDHLVTKRTWGAFTNTDLEQYLRSQGVTQVVVAGVATSIGVESTARQAYELGLNVALAVDAMTDPRPEAHTNSIKNIFPRLGQTGATQEIVDRLENGSAHEERSA